jgi:hypothetical protein
MQEPAMVGLARRSLETRHLTSDCSDLKTPGSADGRIPPRYLQWDSHIRLDFIGAACLPVRYPDSAHPDRYPADRRGRQGALSAVESP